MYQQSGNVIFDHLSSFIPYKVGGYCDCSVYLFIYLFVCSFMCVQKLLSDWDVIFRLSSLWANLKND